MSSTSSIWSTVRFHRGRDGGFALLGVPSSHLDATVLRLHDLGCLGLSFVASSLCLTTHNVYFTCSRSTSGYLALRFPCEGRSPLLVSGSGFVLSGAAESMMLRSLAAGRLSGAVVAQAEVHSR